MSSEPFEGTVEERKEKYIRNGAAIRASRQKPYWLSIPENGLLHVTLNLMYDPVYYLDMPIPQYILDDYRLNLCTGIVDEGVRREIMSGSIPWYQIDWECVPDENESIREAYLAQLRKDIFVRNLLLKDAYSNTAPVNITMNFLALISQPATTYVLPETRIIFQGDLASSIPMHQNLIYRISNYITDNSVPIVSEDVYLYYGIKAYLDRKLPYLKQSNIVSLPDIITNEVLICLNTNPADPLREIGKTIGKYLLFLWASAAQQIPDKVPVTFADQCLDMYNLIELEEAFQ